MSLRPKLVVDWCSHAAAAYAVTHWHYSRTMPVGKLVHLGVWEADVFIGAIVYGWGATHQLGPSFGVPMTACTELVRVALTTHGTPVSKLLAISVRMFRQHCPGVRLLVAFADTSQGHLGGIYQAGNWLYTGMTKHNAAILYRGKILHQRAFTGHNFGTPRKPLPASATKIRGPAKHRYCYPLDEAMRLQLLPRSLPYPKRAISIGADAPTVQVGEGGASPTMALCSGNSAYE